MKKIVLLMVVLFVGVVTAAVAVPSGRTLVFDKSPEGKVTFSGKIHKDAGLKCRDCHNKKVFPKMKKGTVKITMDAIYAGKYCGVCHNGKRAFEAKNNCKRCHVK
ncbi:MAG: cytochrome c3 family protein [Deltaproteobacteria bacterium]|nr:cytochrome c3 family protein [Deltaproteobacteria bacterium]